MSKEIEIPQRFKEIAQTPFHSRTTEQYMQTLGITLPEIGHDVLDIGSGMVEHFARDLNAAGKQVVSLNPSLLLPEAVATLARSNQAQPLRDDVVREYCNWINTVRYPVKNRITLPIKWPQDAEKLLDEEFDTVVSCFGVPLYLEDKDVEEMLVQTQRVLRPNGMGVFAPFSNDKKTLIEAQATKHNIPFSVTPHMDFEGKSTNMHVLKMFKK